MIVDENDLKAMGFVQLSLCNVVKNRGKLTAFELRHFWRDLLMRMHLSWLLVTCIGLVNLPLLTPVRHALRRIASLVFDLLTSVSTLVMAPMMPALQWPMILNEAGSLTVEA